MKRAIKTTVSTIILNILLSLFKGIVGIVGYSQALISDAIHSLSDVLTSIMVLIGIKIASRAPDKEHPYGHEKFESLFAIFLSLILFISAEMIGKTAIKSIINQTYEINHIPSILALIAAIVSIVVKEGMYWYTRAAAKALDSPALMADAWHHRTDALSSIGSLIGIGMARLGFPIADPIASLVICIFIFIAAFKILKSGISQVVDNSIDDKTIHRIEECINNVDGVLHLDLLKTRKFGNKMYVDVEIAADGNLTLTNAHKIAENVHKEIEKDFPKVLHCSVHVNPKN